MNRRLTPAEMDELLGAYALDAVDADEREQIEEYLEENPRARAEVTEHREVAAMMSLAGGQAPDGLWDRIAGELGPDASDGVVPQLRLVPVAEKPKPARRWWGIALASVAAAAIAILGVTVVHQGHRIDDLEAVTSKDSVVVGAAEAMTDPSARLTSLTTPDGATMADVVVQASGQGYLVPRTMPTLASDRTYQMWGVIGDEVISLGVLGNEPSVSAFHTDPRVKTIMVTDEVRGGVPVTEQTPVSQGDLV
jgi:anti-sigma factor RsiW